VDKGDKVVLDPTGRVDRPDNPSREVPRARRIYEDQLVMITPIQGVLDRDVSHTTLYYTPSPRHIEKFGMPGTGRIDGGFLHCDTINTIWNKLSNVLS
jgi:hypothetical protein